MADAATQRLRRHLWARPKVMLRRPVADADGTPEPAPELKRLAEPTVMEAPAITEEPVPQSPAAEVNGRSTTGVLRTPNILTPDVPIRCYA